MLQLQPVSVVFLSSSTVADVPHASNNNDDNNINTNDDGNNDDHDDGSGGGGGGGDGDDDNDTKREIIMMTMTRISITIKHKCLGVWDNKVLVEKRDHL